MATLVVGLGRSGAAARDLLLREGATVRTYDDADGASVDWDGVELVVKSPGVPPHHGVVEDAFRRGLPVIGELELGWRRLRDTNPFVAITGTNGKTTVTQWLGHVLALAGVPHAVAGNVGTPLTSLVGDVEPGAWVVCECSSYQLHDADTFAPRVGVLVNLGSDHLNWHGTVAHYHASKLSMLARAEDIVVPRAIQVPGHARRHDLLEADTTLPGRHNRENAGAVAAAARLIGVGADVIAEGLRTFGGVEHRLERVAELDGVLWINDSKATNVESALVAADAMDRPFHWILGGDDAKGEDFTALREAAGEATSLLLIGAAEARLQRELGGGVPCGTLARAVAEARLLAKPGDAVLLSPACASFDQFSSFEERGRAYKELVG